MVNRQEIKAKFQRLVGREFSTDLFWKILACHHASQKYRPFFTKMAMRSDLTVGFRSTATWNALNEALEEYELTNGSLAVLGE